MPSTERTHHIRAMIRLAKLIGTAITARGALGSLLRGVVAPRLHLVPGLDNVMMDSETPPLRRSSLVVRPPLGRSLAGRLCPNVLLDGGRRFDDVAAGRFALVTSTEPSTTQHAAIEQRGAVLIAARPWSELHRWLAQGGAEAAIVRPDGTVLRAGRQLSVLFTALPGVSTLHGAARGQHHSVPAAVLGAGEGSLAWAGPGSQDGTRTARSRGRRGPGLRPFRDRSRGIRLSRMPPVARHLAVLLLLLWSGMASGAPALALREVGVSRAFQAEYITEVRRDRVGLLWIGTKDGLYLHDGQRFRRFQHEIGNPASMASSAVRTVFEDAVGRLWVGTLSGGLSLLDRARWTFRTFRHDASDPASLPHDGVFALADAEDGRLWVGTGAGLALLDPATARASRTPLVPGGGDEWVMALRRDRAGTLWVGTLGRGLFRRRPGASTFEHVPADARSRAAQDVFSLAEDGKGGLWVGTRDGLYRMAPGAAGLQRVVLSPVEVASTMTTVTELEPDGQGTLWVGTFGAGLFRVDTATGEVRAEKLPADGPGFEQRIDEGTLELDPEGGLFIGTFGMGLFHASLQPEVFRAFRAKGADGGPGLKNEDVWAVLPDGDTHLLVGSFGGGVDRLDLLTGKAERLEVPAPPGDDVAGVLSLLRTRDGALWAGISQGVFRFDPVTLRPRLYRRGLGEGRGQAPGFVNAMLQDSRGRIWLGSGTDGLNLYRPDTDDFRAFRNVAGDPRSLSNNVVTALMEDRRGRLWVGTRSGGLNICTAEENALACARLGALTFPQLSHVYVSALLEDPDGAVWVGTVGGGLQRVSLDAMGRPGDTALWTRAEGLIDDNVMALARAPDRALWVATRGGLSRFDVATNTFENFASSDGLPTVAFNPGGAALLGGRLYWGSAKGLVELDPTVHPLKGPPPPLVITSI
ncbi:MAG: hypothetical protein L0Y64_22780, partial [Myxococcaceae bacterium]|nr:hypothetical protein [Myxococcaceae bacterium]